MGRKKRTSPHTAGPAVAPGPDNQKKAKTEESYPVKKYRPEKHYASMDAFVKYTKSHRMLDAAYVRWPKGATPEKPFVFATRVGGVNLGWGRGKTREAAMDCAVRATFALVAAHGYNNFPLDDDCLAEEPVDAPPPPPPPLPPPPMGMPPLPPGLPPPLPPGAPPFMPPGGGPPPFGAAAPQASDLIPQPKALSTSVAVASSLSSTSSNVAAESAPAASAAAAPLSLSLNATSQEAAAVPKKKKLKGGLTLVFDAGEDGPDEMCLEELRASLPRYQKLLLKATTWNTT